MAFDLQLFCLLRHCPMLWRRAMKLRKQTVAVDPYRSRFGEERRPNAPLLAIGRAVFGGYFLYNGIKHFRELATYAGYAGSKGVPMPKAAVAATGGLLVVGGLSLLAGVRTKLGTSLIELFLMGVSPAMHAYWKTEGNARQTEQVNFMKNMALAGAALVAAAIPEPWPASLGHAR
jgi:putative oxidoreductase